MTSILITFSHISLNNIVTLGSFFKFTQQNLNASGCQLGVQNISVEDLPMRFQSDLIIAGLYFIEFMCHNFISLFSWQSIPSIYVFINKATMSMHACTSWSFNLEEGTAVRIFIFISQSIVRESKVQHALNSH